MFRLPACKAGSPSPPAPLLPGTASVISSIDGFSFPAQEPDRVTPRPPHAGVGGRGKEAEHDQPAGERQLPWSATRLNILHRGLLVAEAAGVGDPEAASS